MPSRFISGMLMHFLSYIGTKLANYLSQPRNEEQRENTFHPDLLNNTIQKGDVLLVEGSSRFSAVIKYLTQSTWSHAALCISTPKKYNGQKNEKLELLEADIVEGVQLIPLSTYWNLHIRICRPVGLTPNEIDKIVSHAESQLGHKYDLKNIIDLARYFIRTPPVPNRFKRRMLSLGSGDPTKGICSSIIAQAFQSQHYPILPEIIIQQSGNNAQTLSHQEILQIRHHSLFTPRDFDISPYFQIIKPSIEKGFDHHQLHWS